MKIIEVIDAMRTIVDAYDKFEARKLKIKKKTKAILKGGKSMKFGTIIGIVVGGLVVLAAGAAAAYFFFKKKECCCDDCCCDCCDDLYEEIPEEEVCCDCAEEVPAEEIAE